MAGFEQVIDGMMPIIQLSAVALGVILMACGAFKIFATNRRGYGESGIPLIVMGIGIGAAGILLPMVMKLISEEGIPQVEKTSEPEPTKEPSKAPEIADPIDLNWLWITLGILAGLICLTLLIWLLIFLSTKARRSIKKAAAEAKEKAAFLASVKDAWEKIQEEHDELLRSYLFAETDWDTLFFRPALTDPGVPETNEMLKTMKVAGDLRYTAKEVPTVEKLSEVYGHPYARAVRNFSMAWAQAERKATRIGQSLLPREERKLIKEIQSLLNIAENSGASQNERNIAYTRIQKLVKGLTHVFIPEKVMIEIEERKMLAITEA